MKKTIVFSAALALSTMAFAQPPSENKNKKSGSISVQEMLISGPTQMKFHSLMMIKQGKAKGEIDESYLPGLQVTANHSDPVLRGITAQILGQKFIVDQESPNPEALALINQLAADDSKDVRFNAAYYGLAQVKFKTPELAEQLIDIAAEERKPELQDRIIISLANYQQQVEEILNEKLKSSDAIAYFEIYEEFTGKEPPNNDKFLDMPSSRPRLLIIKPSAKDTEAAKTALTEKLEKAGIKNPTVEVSGKDKGPMLMLTTYITRDYQTAKKALSGSEDFSIMQDMWLTPELEIQIEAMRKAEN